MNTAKALQNHVIIERILSHSDLIDVILKFKLVSRIWNSECQRMINQIEISIYEKLIYKRILWTCTSIVRKYITQITHQNNEIRISNYPTKTQMDRIEEIYVWKMEVYKGTNFIFIPNNDENNVVIKIGIERKIYIKEIGKPINYTHKLAVKLPEDLFNYENNENETND